ncbi:MAG: Sir2 family NAD-dependent protein deacetylase [Crocinitomicaceae bacterium]|nr:Sir2 family NAD-dependent protein deacetylase [Crocinitomicaceae bacterium]
MSQKSELNLVVFSGAGMSAESGIQTFRDTNGLWENYKIEEVATPTAWRANPDFVTEFYNLRRKAVIEATPNVAHETIAKLESDFKITVITQNIDDLHERAGSSNVLHLHGNIRYSKSSGPNQESVYFPIEGWKLDKSDICPEGYQLRPHVVWFGEEVPAYEKAALILNQADLLIVIGTSLQVHPAAGLIHLASNAKYKFIIDPHAEELSVPNDFTRIKDTASGGMNQIYKTLKKVLSNE